MAELPPHHVIPLVQFQRKIAMASDLLREVWVHCCFACWSYGEAVSELVFAAVGDPGNFCCKSFKMILLLDKLFLGNEDRVRTILHPQGFYALIQIVLDVLPNRPCWWVVDEAAGDVAVVQKACFLDHLDVPLADVVFFLGCDAYQDAVGLALATAVVSRTALALTLVLGCSCIGGG